MHHIRRAALRAVRSQPVAVNISARTPFATRLSVAQSTRQISWPQSRCYSDAAEKASASPAEETGNETVTSEPSAEEQKHIKEESIATSEIADAAQEKTILESAQDKVGEATDALSSFARRSTREFRQSKPDAPPSRIVYVGNLFFDLTPDQLRREFANHGRVTNCKIVTDSSGMSKGFGYVEFDSLDSATSAIEALNGKPLAGRKMAVQYHIRRSTEGVRRGPTNPPSPTLFIGNMSFQMSDKDLHDLFKTTKGVVDVRVAIDRRSGQPRGFAHADFVDIESATAAKSYLEGKVIFGRNLRVDYGLPSRSRRGEQRQQSEEQL